MMGAVEEKGFQSRPSGDAAIVNEVARELENLKFCDSPPAVAAAVPVADGVHDADGDDDDGDDEDGEDDEEEEEREDDNGEDDGGEKKQEKEEDGNRKKKKRKKKKKKEKQKGVDEGRSGDGPVSSYPQRPNEPDCAFYMKNGSCKYGMNCRFNHPSASGQNKQAAKGKEWLPERVGLPECKISSPSRKRWNWRKAGAQFLGPSHKIGREKMPFLHANWFLQVCNKLKVSSS